ncbi:MAG: ParA family protein [Chloroflexi bacterium]|nr:ParA family protein [Chloroflexota bacterium]
MARIYSLVNQKGGVGKTTTAINLGAYLAYFGQRVLLVDIDPQSNTTSCLGIDKYGVKSGSYDALMDAEKVEASILHNPRLKISLLPASPSLAGAEVELVNELARETRLKEALEPIKDHYDYILIDCPPSLGLLTLNGMVAAQDGLIIPVQCEYLALEGLSMLNQTIERVRSAIFPALKVRGVVLTMYDGRTNLAKDVVAEVRKHFPQFVMETLIPRSVRLAEAPSYGLPILAYYPSSPGGKAYNDLAREVLKADGVQVAV